MAPGFGGALATFRPLMSIIFGAAPRVDCTTGAWALNESVETVKAICDGEKRPRPLSPGPNVTEA